MNFTAGKKRITLADIGIACGYHGTTVGLALKNSPRIPASTREKIQRVAQEMGYHPDPALASLVAYRHQKTKPKYHSKIALITDQATPNAWLGTEGYGQNVLKGISQSAVELGYETELFYVGINHEKESRIDRILQARGISAIIILGLHHPGIPINLNWENYSVVSIGYSHPNPHIAKVSSRNRWAAFRCVQELCDNGYRKPVLIVSEVTDSRSGHCWSAGYLSACYKFHIPFGDSIFLHKDYIESYFDDILSFIWKYNPDSIVTHDPYLLPVLRENGFQVPSDLGFLCLDIPDKESDLSGIYQNAFEIGQQAVNVLFNLQVKNVRGLVSHELVHLVSGTWMPGKTMLRSRNSFP